MSTATIIIGFVLSASIVWAIFFGRRLPKQFRNRDCQGKGWRSAFPSASKQEIREFLSLFVCAFAFSEKEKLKLSPDDKIYLIYRALYPSKLMPDALELEILCKDVDAKYGVNLASVWSETLTIGDLFAIVRRGQLP